MLDTLLADAAFAFGCQALVLLPAAPNVFLCCFFAAAKVSRVMLSTAAFPVAPMSYVAFCSAVGWR